ncbi:hypothetical protein FIBSPDRAFT_222529 [Athelia psychrophila]|uniref:Heme haloperoxidase family profile domain-containing protein n=1 Tax=Athelia psychrophila TaxID=1759441 RepID=A0A165YYT9_9AGAM|nr:hypothetical protein FIBSPDRAFT_222529 [Fibularhizoctonia sp. CBS 109695]
MSLRAESFCAIFQSSHLTFPLHFPLYLPAFLHPRFLPVSPPSYLIPSVSVLFPIQALTSHSSPSARATADAFPSLPSRTPSKRPTPSSVLAWSLSIGAFILLQFTPISLSDIARHNYIEHNASLVHNNTPLEDEYAPAAINHALVDALMADGQDGLMSVVHIGAARVRRENESPALDRLHAEIARGEMVIALRVLAAPNAGIPLPWLRTWIHDETFPAGWAPSLGDTREAEGNSNLFSSMRITK